MWIVLILFMAGMALILAEFFVPGGALGVVGALFLVGSVALGWYRFPEFGFYILGAEMAGSIVCVALGLYIMTRTRVGQLLVMADAQDKAAGYSSPHESVELEGTLATVQTALRPAGTILAGGRRVDAVSSGTFIDADKTVRIVQVEGHRVVCEEVEDGESSESS